MAPDRKRGKKTEDNMVESLGRTSDGDAVVELLAPEITTDDLHGIDRLINRRSRKCDTVDIYQVRGGGCWCTKGCRNSTMHHRPK